ncbi:addiction module protein [Rhodanobacter lindaniclasticus]
MKQADLIKEALKLDARARANMAGQLLESLDDLSADEVEHLWLEGARRRDAAIQSGRLSSLPAQQVIAGLKAELG